jgi:hypothetical protein
VRAEAVSWATAVCSALDWGRIHGAEIGGPDRWWDCPTAQAVGFRGRAEVRVPLPVAAGDGNTDGHGAGDGNTDGHGEGDADRDAHRGIVKAGGPGLALFVVMPGWPGATGRSELGVTALAHALAAPAPGSVPVRVVGWWPQTGRSTALDVDRRLLEQAADDATGAVATALARHPRPAAA